jgi:hypothetical protein
VTKYVTVSDIVIPAGTELDASPSRIIHFYPHVCAIIAHGKDHISTWNIDLEEAVKLGLVKEVATA